MSGQSQTPKSGDESGKRNKAHERSKAKKKQGPQENAKVDSTNQVRQAQNSEKEKEEEVLMAREQNLKSRPSRRDDIA